MICFQSCTTIYIYMFRLGGEGGRLQTALVDLIQFFTCEHWAEVKEQLLEAATGKLLKLAVTEKRPDSETCPVKS